MRTDKVEKSRVGIVKYRQDRTGQCNTVQDEIRGWDG